MRERSGAVIVQNGFLLVVKRVRSHKHFFVLPGGGVEEGETIEEACLREVLEETGLTVRIDKKLCTIDTEKQVEHYFQVTVLAGIPIIGEPEVNRQTTDNESHLQWINEAQIDRLQPEEMHSICVDCLTLV